MKIIPTGLYNQLLFNLLFFKIENLKIGFTTTALLGKLLNEGDITNQQFNRFWTAARAFHIRTYEYALDNLPRNDDLLINAQVRNFETRRSASSSIDQLLYFIKRYVLYFLEGLAKYLLRKPLRLYSQISDCVIIMFVLSWWKKVLISRETYFLVLKIFENVFFFNFKKQFQHKSF